MEVEDIVKEITLKGMKAETKKYGLSDACRTKIDVTKDLPGEVL